MKKLSHLAKDAARFTLLFALLSFSLALALLIASSWAKADEVQIYKSMLITRVGELPNKQ